ncbi:MAG: hypothetical protein KJ950_07165 [Proteobacteria bacterium]|nr:hypothetical protein [Pseudomonadota bacterium]MBU1687024.1 hypothetical protein [Pseudomonadota bacterium]
MSPSLQLWNRPPSLGHGQHPPSATKITPAIIGFDIDGVVADTMEAFIRIAADQYNLTVPPHQLTEFMAEDCLDMDPAIIEEIFHTLLHHPLAAQLRPMPGAITVLTEFSQTTRLTFITARPDPDPIAEWLEHHLGSQVYSRCRLIATGDHNAKAPHIRSMDLRYFIDDRVETCHLLAEEPDITPIVFDQPWNNGRHQLQLVHDWQHIRTICRA